MKDPNNPYEYELSQIVEWINVWEEEFQERLTIDEAVVEMKKFFSLWGLFRELKENQLDEHSESGQM